MTVSSGKQHLGMHRKPARPVKIGALSAEAMGGMPAGKVLSDLENEFWGKTFGLRLEAISWKVAERAAAA